MNLLRTVSMIVLIALLCAGTAGAQTTTRASLNSMDQEGADSSFGTSSLSADGRHVAFYSVATNLVADDTNGKIDTFVRDRQLGTTVRVSLANDGGQADADCREPSISANGRYVAFHSMATNLVPGDTNAAHDVFVRDLLTAETTRVSVDSTGAELGGFWPDISDDGRFVAFHAFHVLVHDRQTGATATVSVASDGTPANNWSNDASISSDGRLVAFHSIATNLVPGDTNGKADIFVHDLQTGATVRVSEASGGGQSDDHSYYSSISSDGRYVAFESEATNLGGGDHLHSDVFVHDLQTKETFFVSKSSDGTPGNRDSYGSSLSGDGRFVAFASNAYNLVPDDSGSTRDVFVHDRLSGATVRANVASDGSEAENGASVPAISASGTRVSFSSLSSNLVADDANGTWDIFVRELGPAPEFLSSCFGDGSGAPCGCTNESPPGSGRGCLNGLGVGALLTLSGIPSLSVDTLAITSQGLPTQPGMFVQGDIVVGGGAGLTFGDGIRCCGTAVIRLEIVLPPGAEPATVHSSVVISDRLPPGSLSPGDSRCYQYWYRDPAGSPCGFGFNLSSAVQTTWLP